MDQSGGTPPALAHGDRHMSPEPIAPQMRAPRETVDALIRDTLDSIDEAFFIVDHAWRILYLNSAARSLMTLPDSQNIEGSILRDVAPQIAGSAFEQACRDAMQSRHTAVFDADANGRTYQVTAHANADALSVLLRDVTNANTAERAFRDKADFLTEASRLLTGTLDYQETLRRLAHMAVPRMADWCAVYTEDEDGTLRVMEAACTDPARVSVAMELNERWPPDPQQQTGIYAVHRSGEPEWVREITDDMLAAGMQDEEQRARVRELGLRSVVMVPLVAREQKLGVMAFIYAESGRLYEQDDVVFAQDLANRAAVAADNARLFESAQRARKEAERRQNEEVALRKAAEAVSAMFSVEEVIHEIAHSALEATSADGSFVERVDPTANRVEVIATAGEMTPAAGDIIPFEGSIAEMVLQSNQPAMIDVLGQSEYPLPGTLADTYRTGSALVVPLIDAGEAVGVLVLLRSEENGAFTRDEAARAHTFGNLASLAFRKVHLLEASEQRSRELEQVMESRTRLVRGFSHDLKNPLGAADGHAALLEDGLLGELQDKQLNSIRRIRAALKSALDLINDLNELARAESGLIQLKQQPVDVREIVRELVEHYRAAAQQAGLTITGKLGDVAIVPTDADRVRQVLGNLISNAVKYTSTGGQVEVRTRMTGDGGQVAIDVADTGLGIPEDKIGLLFTEFARIDPSVRPGVGLGLAISRRIARLLNGDITVETRRGEGSTFTLCLPASKGA